MKRLILIVIALGLFLSCGGGKMKNWHKVPLPQGYGDSHILSITARNNVTLLGTYGRGALMSHDGGNNWTVYDTSNGLSWNFVLGGDWDDSYLILATLGDGVNISTDNGASWARYGYNFFGIEYLYTVGAIIKDHIKYVPSADGLVIFADMDSIKDWHSLTEKDGLASQYLYDIAMKGDTIALGSLHGYSISPDHGKTWNNFSPNGKFTPEKIAACKVRAVEFSGDDLYAGCDDGLYMSTDRGQTWNQLGADKLASGFIHDLVFDKAGRLWMATYKEVASFDPQSKSWALFGNGLPGGSINCLGIDENGAILVGTNYGLFLLSSGQAYKPAELPVDATYMETEEPLHQWMLRPIGPTDQNDKDQTYLYGSTMGGNFRQHQGNEYNNPEGVPILAVDDGTIVFVADSIGHSVLKCDRQENGEDIFAHYHHQHQILKRVGDHVKRGEVIGTVGKKGNVTNEHLHFEVAYTEVGSPSESTMTHTRNSELWVAPLPGCGTIVGRLVDSQDRPVGGVRIYGLTKPIPTETPFSFAETYLDKVNPDNIYNENFAIGDVPGGDYNLYAEAPEGKSRIRVHVEPGKFTRVKMQLK
jgi:murein DD-endopeptidase MepM/ murein hydrolase activator NlpD/photosystem II stability/assembly factor-like uncharacterized protein